MGLIASKTTKSRIVFPTAPVSLTFRTATSLKESLTATLRQAVEERCPNILQDFVSPWWLSNGHLQTLYVVAGDFTKIDHVVYDRTYIRTIDGGTIGLDFTPAESSSLPDDTPIIVVMHGLTGGSHEAYVRNILSKACASVGQGGLGYRGVVVNFRGCAGTPLTSPQLYSAGWTEDFRQSLMYIAHRYPGAPLHGLGFSLGSNIMVRYLGEEKEQSRLSSACVLGCPWDLADNNTCMESTFLGRHVYSKGMADNLIRLLRRHAKSLGKKPDHDTALAMERAFALKSPTLEQFDNTFTCRAGGGPPHFPMESSAEYYAWGGSHLLLADVRVPLLTINADDDPVIHKVPTDVDNPDVVMVVTSGGGHLGWFESSGRWGEVTRWVSKPVLEWLKMQATDVVAVPRGKELFVGEDGFIRERGSDDLGCMVIDGGGLVDETKDGALIQGL